MKLYDVTETVVYRVVAVDEDSAEQIIIDSENRQQYFLEVLDCHAKEV